MPNCEEIERGEMQDKVHQLTREVASLKVSLQDLSSDMDHVLKLMRIFHSYSNPRDMQYPHMLLWLEEHKLQHPEEFEETHG
jgi:hypothetical protein